MVSVPFLKPEKIEELAAGVLENASLLSIPVDPVALAKRHDISVYSIDFAEDEVCGLLRTTNGSVGIYVNSDHAAVRMRYTLAHELGHFFLHRDAMVDFVDSEINLYRSMQPASESETDASRRMEIQANMFAAALLMPKDLVSQEFAKNQDVATLAAKFAVSRSAMGHRIDNLGL